MRKTSSESIYEALKDDIIYLRRKPGEELNIQALSEEMNVSRSPVRDALIRLQSEALVDMLPQRGSWVSHIDLDRVYEERLLRISLEECVLGVYKDKIKNSDLAQMEYYIELQKEAISSNDSQGFFSSDDAMHHVYYQASGLERFWTLCMRESGNYRRIRILSFDSSGSSEKNISQHIEVLDAFKKRDFHLLMDVVHRHLSKLDYERDEIMNEHPDYFVENTR